MTPGEVLAVIQMVLAGAVDEFEKLVRQYRPLVVKVVSRFLKEPEDIKEAVQRTFEDAFEGLANFDLSKDFRLWLLGIARHRVADILREIMAPLEPLTEDDGTEDQDASKVPATDKDQDPAIMYARRVQRTRLWQAMRFLPHFERFCVILHCIKGRSFPKIAKRLGCSESQAKRAVYRGLRKLKFLDRRFHFFR